MRLKTFSQTSLLATSLLLSTGLLVGCGDERAKDDSAAELRVKQPAQIMNESKDNYDDNVNGLITHSTLEKWLEDWDKNKPAGIKGKLVIFQQGEGPVGAKFIKPDNQKTFTYVESGWLETRSNGLANIPSIVISGPSIDAIVKRYGIDLKNDMIVCAQGANGTGTYMNQGRCWFAFSYWGVDQKQIAVLNGNNDYFSAQASFANYLTDTKIDTKNPSPIVNRQVSSVKDLKVDNTSIYASVEDVINVLPLTDEPDNNDGVLLWDARSLPQYSAGLAKWSGASIDVGSTFLQSSFQNNAARQSHPRGALNLEFTNLIDVPTGLYHDKQTLKNILAGQRSPNGQSFVSGGLGYDEVGAGNAYQAGDTIIHYCETSLRAAITIVATGVILGIPSRMYDSAMIEWNSLTSGVNDKNGNPVLAAGSPWDTEYLSFPVAAYGTNIAPRSAAGWAADIGGATTAEDVIDGLLKSPLIVDAFAEHVDQVVLEDRAYKQPKVVAPEENTGSGSTGGGSILPSNPCGG